MPITVTISGTPIQFPVSADSPNWAPAITQFAELTADALASVAGPYDIPPQIYTMVANVNTNVSLPALAFPVAAVQGAAVQYTVYRSTTGSGATTVSEFGTLEVIYNPNNPTGNKWEMSREYTGNGDVTFSITDLGQVQFSSTSITGSNHSGTIGYTAKSLLITD
jgi:hypothetical protein